VRQVLAKLLPPEKLAEPAPTAKPLAVVDAVKRLLRGDDRIKVKGTDDLLVYRAKCCNPIMGEPIVGYITRGKGVSVHSLSLPERDQPGLRPLSVGSRSSGSRGAEGGYEVRLAVGLQDRPGALAAVTAALAAVKTDVRDAQVRTFDDKTASIELTVRISDKKHLDRVLKSVRGVSGVIDVARHSVRAERARLRAAGRKRIGSNLPAQEVSGRALQVRVFARGAPADRALLAGSHLGGLLFCSGQIALHPQTGELVEGDVAVQTDRVLQNLIGVLHAAKMGPENVVKATVYLADMADFAKMNEVYAKYLGTKPPGPHHDRRGRPAARRQGRDRRHRGVLSRG
jgi:reactive intermediate/imine deaminase